MTLPKKVIVLACAVGTLITIGVVSTLAGPVAVAGRAVATAPEITLPSVVSPAPVLTVVEVVDGDTVELSDGRTVRILGIDAPETVAPGEPVGCWGPEATEFAQQMLLNQPVVLVEDLTQDPMDADGRTLAYVMLPDGRDFSVLAAETGHARASRSDIPVQRQEAILAAESRAHADELGVWGPECASPKPTPTQPAPTRSVAPQPTPPPAAALQPVPPRRVPTPPPAPGPQPSQPTTVPQSTVPPSDPAPVPTAEPTPGPDAESPVYYQNCAEARAAGAAPLHAGEPGYRPGLDSDGDGVACES